MSVSDLSIVVMNFDLKINGKDIIFVMHVWEGESGIAWCLTRPRRKRKEVEEGEGCGQAQQAMTCSRKEFLSGDWRVHPSAWTPHAVKLEALRPAIRGWLVNFHNLSSSQWTSSEEQTRSKKKGGKWRNFDSLKNLTQISHVRPYVYIASILGLPDLARSLVCLSRLVPRGFSPFWKASEAFDNFFIGRFVHWECSKAVLSNSLGWHKWELMENGKRISAECTPSARGC